MKSFGTKLSWALILTLLLELPGERHFCFTKAEISKSGLKPNRDEISKLVASKHEFWEISNMLHFLQSNDPTIQKQHLL